MTVSLSTNEASRGNAFWIRLRAMALSRLGLLVLAASAVAVGLFFNWHALVAAGIAPILISALPCTAMCALGLCMAGGAKKSCHSTSDQPPTSGAIDQTPEKTAGSAVDRVKD
jgi:hypothetical protein